MAVSAVLVSVTVSARAAGECKPSAPWEYLPETGAELVRPVPIILIGAGIAAPLAMVPSGADHRLRVLSQRDLGGRYDLEPVSVIAPYALASAVLVSYGVSVVLEDCELGRIQAAMLQAMALSAGTMLTLKWVTGRQFPTGNSDPNAPDRLEHPENARQFEPFALRLNAWPSGHSIISFSAAAALRSAWPRGGLWRFAGYPFALGVAAGMWLGDHHWASDIVSGALFGEAIGGSVGNAFAPEPRHEPELTFLPVPGGGLRLVYGGAF